MALCWLHMLNVRASEKCPHFWCPRMPQISCGSPGQADGGPPGWRGPPPRRRALWTLPVALRHHSLQCTAAASSAAAADNQEVNGMHVNSLKIHFDIKGFDGFTAIDRRIHVTGPLHPCISASRETQGQPRTLYWRQPTASAPPGSENRRCCGLSEGP
jgi:hypothetical protein